MVLIPPPLQNREGCMEQQAPLQTWIAKHRRYIIVVIALVPVIACAIGGLRRLDAFLRGEPNFADVQNDLRLIQQRQVKPDAWGRIMFQHDTAYMTSGVAKNITVLWPYNLAHDDNYFEGLLFSDIALTSNEVTALGPVRGGSLNAPRSWLTHLTIDRTVSDHWYHVQGEMYK